MDRDLAAADAGVPVVRVDQPIVQQTTPAVSQSGRRLGGHPGLHLPAADRPNPPTVTRDEHLGPRMPGHRS